MTSLSPPPSKSSSTPPNPFSQSIDSKNFLLTVSSIAFFSGLAGALLLAKRKGLKDSKTDKWLKAAELKVGGETTENGFKVSSNLGGIQALKKGEVDETSTKVFQKKNFRAEDLNDSPPPSVLMRSKSSKPLERKNEQGEVEDGGEKQTGYSDVMKALGIATLLVASTTWVTLEVAKRSLGAKNVSLTCSIPCSMDSRLSKRLILLFSFSLLILQQLEELTDKLRDLIPKNKTTIPNEDQDLKNMKLSKPLPKSEIFSRLDSLALKANAGEDQSQSSGSNMTKKQVIGVSESKDSGKTSIWELLKGKKENDAISNEISQEEVEKDEGKSAREEWMELIVAQLEAESREQEEERLKRKK